MTEGVRGRERARAGQREREREKRQIARERRVDVTFVLDAGTDKAERELYMPVRTRAERHGKGRTVRDSYQPAPSDRADSIFLSPS